MTLQEILHAKGVLVHTISVSATLDDVVQKLVQNNCGSLVVVDQRSDSRRPRMLGIVTERDILRACAQRRGSLDDRLVSEVMTAEVITGTPHDSIEETMQVMTERRIRHLPIVDQGELIGLVSIGDVVKARHQQTEFENHYLKTYIQS